MTKGRIALTALAFAALLVSKHPQILTQANFWAEDGAAWYPQARAHGAISLLWPVAGYLQTFSRLAGLLAQLLPVRWAPLGFALLALAIQVAPPTFIVSGRLNSAWPNARTRWLAALACIALPNAYEVYVNVTNAQWHLALLAFLIVVADPPARWPGWWFDTLGLLLAGLSGPCCLLLAPVAAWQAWERPSRTTLGRLGIVVACAAVQAGFLASMPGARTAAPLGATPLGFAEILSLHVFLAPLVGLNVLSRFTGLPLWRSGALPMAIMLGGIGLAALGWRAGPAILRKFMVFAGLILVAALLHPQVSAEKPQWPGLATAIGGGRYWFMPMLAFAGVLLSLAGMAPARPVRRLATLLLACTLVSSVVEWQRWAFGGSPDFAAAARRFEAAAPGTLVSFPIRPPGWQMTLVR